MIKKLLVLLTTTVSAIVLTTADSINAADMRSYHEAMQKLEFQSKFELVGTYTPSIHNKDLLKAKYDLDFSGGLAQNEKYMALIDSEYNVVVYKKKKTLKRQDAFTESDYAKATPDKDGKVASKI